MIMIIIVSYTCECEIWVMAHIISISTTIHVRSTDGQLQTGKGVNDAEYTHSRMRILWGARGSLVGHTRFYILYLTRVLSVWRLTSLVSSACVSRFRDYCSRFASLCSRRSSDGTRHAKVRCPDFTEKYVSDVNVHAVASSLLCFTNNKKNVRQTSTHGKNGSNSSCPSVSLSRCRRPLT